ncbi:MAG: hypothetical protein ABJU19_10595 [Roseobacter sp.]
MRKSLGEKTNATAIGNRPKVSNAVKNKKASPAVKKPASVKKQVTKTSIPALKAKPKAIKKNSGAGKARAASSRGKASGKKLKRKG